MPWPAVPGNRTVRIRKREGLLRLADSGMRHTCRFFMIAGHFHVVGFLLSDTIGTLVCFCESPVTLFCRAWTEKCRRQVLIWQPYRIAWLIMIQFVNPYTQKLGQETPRAPTCSAMPVRASFRPPSWPVQSSSRTSLSVPS